MFENKNRLDILAEELDLLPEDINKREGSLSWEMLSIYAAELEITYEEFERLLKNAFAQTAEREYLIRKADTFNLYPYPATKAVVQAEFELKEGTWIDNGTRFEINGVYYRVIERVSDKLYNLECETAGTIGNEQFGQILPLINVKGFEKATVVRLVLPGSDEESTEDFRARFKAYFNVQAFGGNEADYIRFTTPIQGVGDIKVLRCPRGPGTVDIIMIDSRMSAPTEETISYVQNLIQPLDVTGWPEYRTSGLGIAPIGHRVLVKGAKTVPITITVNPVYREGYSWEQTKSTIEEKINAYFKDEIENWGSSNDYFKPDRILPEDKHITITLSKIESLLLDVEGIIDYDRSKSAINGSATNFELEFDEIPVLENLNNG